MSLIGDIKLHTTNALKSGDSQKANTLRSLIASVHNEEIANRSKGGTGELSDEEVVGVLQKEAKKRKEAAEIYGKAGRGDLENNEKYELSVIESYLPPALTDADVEKIVARVASDGGGNFGNVMGAVMKEIAGRADAKVVTEIVKKSLGGAE